MVRFFRYAIPGAFLGVLLGGFASREASAASTALGAASEEAPVITLKAKRVGQKKAPAVINTPESAPEKAPAINTREAAREKKPIQKSSIQKSKEKAPVKVVSETLEPKPLKKKTLIIDARRLKDHKLTETIRFIQDHPDTRFKLANMTIDPAFITPLMTSLKEAKVLDQIRDIGFVMLPTAKGQVLDEGKFIAKVLPYLEHLEGLELSCLGITDKVAKAIATKIPNLKSLSLFGPGVTDATITSLSNGLPDLTKIHLINTHLTPQGIRNLTKFSKLRNLGVSGPNIKDKDFSALKDMGENLHSLAMVGQTFKDTKTVPDLLGAMPKLHTLDLSETNVTDDVAKALVETSKGLRSLNISETKITYAGVQEIVERLDLHTLKMDQLKGIGDKELKFIVSSQPGLKKFHFAGAYFSDSSIMSIILNLQKLTDVTFIPVAGSKWILSEAVAEALIHKKRKLQYLHIQSDRLPEALRMKLDTGIPNLNIEFQG